MGFLQMVHYTCIRHNMDLSGGFGFYFILPMMFNQVVSLSWSPRFIWSSQSNKLRLWYQRILVQRTWRHLACPYSLASSILTCKQEISLESNKPQFKLKLIDIYQRSKYLIRWIWLYQETPLFSYTRDCSLEESSQVLSHLETKYL